MCIVYVQLSWVKLQDLLHLISRALRVHPVAHAGLGDQKLLAAVQNLPPPSQICCKAIVQLNLPVMTMSQIYSAHQLVRMSLGFRHFCVKIDIACPRPGKVRHYMCKNAYGSRAYRTGC